jgi:Tfp pilus assembly protein PilN
LTVNNFLQAQTKEQSAFIELLKQQLEVKDEQIATTNRIADQAQQLDLTTHKQSQPSLPQQTESEHPHNKKHGLLW